MAVKTYKDGTPFTGSLGVHGRVLAGWPEPLRLRREHPMCFSGYWTMSVSGSYPVSGVWSRHLCYDSLASNGLRYTNMHTTALVPFVWLYSELGATITRLVARSPRPPPATRVTTASCLLTGELIVILLPKGYNTFCVGKWHLTPPEHTTAAGPYERWPLGRGFERFYGFLGGETNQWYPELSYDNHVIEPPALPEEGYHLSSDLADKAIEFIQDAHVNAPDKPFFLYYATGAGHAPHHVPKEWADKYKGKFDMGWDVYREIVHKRQLEMGILPPGTELSAHDPDMPVWDTLPGQDAKRLYARMMEVFAGSHEFHRLSFWAYPRVPERDR